MAVHMVIADIPWLVRTVIGLGGRIEVVGPADVRHVVLREAERMLSEAP